MASERLLAAAADELRPSGVWSTDPAAELLGALGRLDELLADAVAAARVSMTDGNDYAGLYVTDAEVDALLAGRHHVGPGHVDASMVLEDGWRPGSRLAGLGARFGLTAFEVGAVLVCVAPELDLGYERIYAYLQDDLTRRRPTVDLVVNLLCPTPEAKLAARRCFAPTAPLLASRLLLLCDDPDLRDAPLHARRLRVDERVVRHLLADDAPDDQLLPWLLAPASTRGKGTTHVDAASVARIARTVRQSALGCLVVLHGPRNADHRGTAERVAGELGLALVAVDGAAIAVPDRQLEPDVVAALALREAVLRSAALYVEGADALLGGTDRRARNALLSGVQASATTCILATSAPFEPGGQWRELPVVQAPVAALTASGRAAMWTCLLSPDLEPVDAQAVASTFALGVEEIRDAAVAAARQDAEQRGGPGTPVTRRDVLAACRRRAARAPGPLTRAIEPVRTWADLVLPDEQVAQLRDVCARVTQRALVHEAWGFTQHLSMAAGVTAMFAGPSGSGKTLAAEVIASELGVVLHAVDLAGVVSKFIGETEKHLAAVFDGAEGSGAVLLFDEADALFGKRSEVQDAHDRYANIEVSYLLQRLERYDGVAILATNLRQHIDEAFLRRLAQVVQFTLPDEAGRKRIWDAVWPPAAPLGADVDTDHLAATFKLSGGSIRNAAVGAAFRAAVRGEEIGMVDVLAAINAEERKMGRVVSSAARAEVDG